ncbi:MAG: pantoate--beta-alanine ligase [Pseudomonadota bacterium]
MKVFYTVDEMREWSRAQKRAKRTIAFVPTMGALHEGHLSLMREAKKHGDLLAVSIYVNPAQFGPNEDLNKYPRTLEQDIAKSKDVGAHAVFIPTDDQIYPDGFQTYVNVQEMTKSLCGASRPTHFMGVTTVVAKLFNIIRPDVSIFGEKDFQQLAVIRRMVSDLNMPIKIIGCPIVREADGLAMSSRNKYLSPEERAAALSLSRSLKHVEKMVAEGENSARVISAAVGEIIASEKLVRIDYISLVDAGTLEDIDEVDRPTVLAIAAFVGSTRLIDNICLSGKFQIPNSNDQTNPKFQ